MAKDKWTGNFIDGVVFHIPVKKAGVVIDVSWPDMPDISQLESVFYGLKQKVNDGLAPYTTNAKNVTDNVSLLTAAQMADEVDSIVGRIMAGDWRSSRAVNSVVAFARKLCRTRAINTWEKANPGGDRKKGQERCRPKKPPCFDFTHVALRYSISRFRTTHAAFGCGTSSGQFAITTGSGGKPSTFK